MAETDLGGIVFCIFCMFCSMRLIRKWPIKPNPRKNWTPKQAGNMQELEKIRNGFPE